MKETSRACTWKGTSFYLWIAGDQLEAWTGVAQSLLVVLQDYVLQKWIVSGLAIFKTKALIPTFFLSL